MSTENVWNEARLLREVVAAVINHLAAGGHVVRNDRFFKDLRRVHRESRDLQQRIEQHPEYRQLAHWQNVACCMAFFAGLMQGKMQGTWLTVLDSLLEVGGEQVTSFAISIATELGIELRESHDGGKSWVPMREFRLQLEQIRDDELFRELQRRGYRYRDGVLEKLQSSGVMPREPFTPAAGERVVHLLVRDPAFRERVACGAAGWPHLARTQNRQDVTCGACRIWSEPRQPTLLDHLEAAEGRTDPAVAAVIEQLAQQVPPDLEDEARRERTRRTPVLEQTDAAAVHAELYNPDRNVPQTLCGATGRTAPPRAGVAITCRVCLARLGSSTPVASRPFAP
jgi:hypothetical protein